MTLIIRKLDPSDALLAPLALEHHEAIKQSVIKTLCKAIELRVTAAALSCGLYFRPSKPLAVISGAGIAGLAASFELRARGFHVVIAEKRKSFSRFNVINLNVETQGFLKKFNLLESFEKLVASRIKEHRYVLIEKSGATQRFALSDVSELRFDESITFEPKNFTDLFTKDGIYSVPIGVLQTFLAEKALENGVTLLGNVKIKILSRTQTGGISQLALTCDRIVQPDLVFIAEGAHSTMADELGFGTRKIVNVCTDENWIFGNRPYFGKETFVVSLIDTFEKTLRMANVIFNAKSQVINIAVTSGEKCSEKEIRKQIERTAEEVFTQTAFPMERIPGKLLAITAKPVRIVNRTSFPFSMGNVFCIGDSAGSSSPLAGLGGTLGLTLVPRTVNQLLDDYEKRSMEIHQNFHLFSEGYTSRWIEKSEGIKKLCLDLFDQQTRR